MANGILSGGLTVPQAERRARSRLLTQQQARQQRMLDALLASARSPEERAGLQIGAGFGGGLAEGIFGTQVPDVETDPEVMEARESMALAQQMQTLTQGEDAVQPGTPEFFTRAAVMANEAGRPDLALALGQQAQTAQQAAATRAAKAAKEEAAARLQNFRAQPSDIQLALVAEDPTIVSLANPNLSEEQVTTVGEQAAQVLETRKLKNVAELNKVSPAKVTKVSKNDINQVGALLTDAGLGEDAFPARWWGTDAEAFGQFATKMADQVLAEQDIAAKEGQRLTRNQIINDIRKDLEARGALTIQDGEVTGVDSQLVNAILNSRLEPEDDAQDPAPRKREGILKL